MIDDMDEKRMKFKKLTRWRCLVSLLWRIGHVVHGDGGRGLGSDGEVRDGTRVTVDDGATSIIGVLDQATLDRVRQSVWCWGTSKDGKSVD